MHLQPLYVLELSSNCFCIIILVSTFTHKMFFCLELSIFLIQINGSLLPASVISVYSAYVCYTALTSEPSGYVCNGLNKSKAVSTSTLLLGMLTTVLSILYSAFRAGSSKTFLSPPSSPKSGT